MFVVLIRTAALYLAVMLAIRIMGKRTIGELQASELVTTLLISDIAAVPMQEVGIPLLSGVMPIAMLVIIEICVSCLLMKFGWLAKLVNGSPVIVVNDGKPVRDALKKLRMTNEDLFEALRKEGVFDLDTVRFAIIETDGKLSVLQKSESQPASAREAGVKVAGESVCALVISDGELDRQSLELAGWNEDRLDKAIDRLGAKRKDIELLAVRNDEGGEIVILKDGKGR